MVLYLLFESAAGYGLFEKIEGEDVASQSSQFQESLKKFEKFKSIVKLKSFQPFLSAENALENTNDVTEGVMNETLKTFLTANLKKSKGSTLGVSEEKLGSAINEGTGIKCEKNLNTAELLRGIRDHFASFVKSSLKTGDLEKAQRGLGHSYSRSKVKFNVHRVDNMIIQSISLLDQLDKDLNTFAMRCKEWYSWHFPELIRVVPDQGKFARLVKLIGDKSNLSEDNLPEMEEITGDADTAKEILDAARSSMGTDINEIDLVNIEQFAERVIQLTEYRAQLHSYLIKKMNDVAPNLSTLLGEQVGARLISHAGSLTNLAKYPASTVQILGAEKALFRALKTKGNTPKYGLLFHSSFIGKAAAKNKGRISRYLANKCSIASRIDSFSDVGTTKYGEALKSQVEERLKFYETGVKPRKNLDVMHQVLEEVKADGLYVEEDKSKTPKKSKKSKKEEEKEDEMEVEEQPKKTPKKSKKEEEKTPKKKQTPKAQPVEEEESEEEKPTKSKKRSKEVATPKKKEKVKETPKKKKKS